MCLVTFNYDTLLDEACRSGQLPWKMFLMDALGSNPFQLRFNVWASGTQTGHEAPASWISSNELPEPRVEDLSSQGQANLAARYEAAQN